MDALSRLWARESGYTSVLQQDAEKQHKTTGKPTLRRILLVAFLFVIPVSFLIAYTLEWVWQSRATTPRRRFPYGRVIQLEDVQAREARLPQHNLDLPFPEGRNGRFVFFADHNQTGLADFATRWSELSVYATLALLSQRANVFEPLVLKDGAWPIGLFLAGPAAGGNWGPGVDAPRAISTQHPASLAANTSFMRTFDDLLRPLLVLHVPRPTSAPCSSFVGWAQLPSLPDRQDAASCAPTVAQIVTKVGLSLEQYAATLPAAQAPPDHVYIDSDADDAFVEELKRDLLSDEDGNGGRKWKVVATSKDLILMGAENEAMQAVEIEIARRAALFVGSGFSSTSSAVVALRLAQGSLPSTIRFF